MFTDGFLKDGASNNPELEFPTMHSQFFKKKRKSFLVKFSKIILFEVLLFNIFFYDK